MGWRKGGESTMEATRTRSATGFGQSWRELAHTPTYQVPIVLGSIVALLVGILTYIFAAANASAIVPATPEMAYMVIFGIVGLIAYGVAKQNVQNGSIVAAIAGLALVVLVAAPPGLSPGLLLLSEASEALQRVGLGRYEALVFVNLARSGAATAGELARASGVNRVQTYRALESLESRGLVEVTIDRPRRYAARAIDEVFEIIAEE